MSNYALWGLFGPATWAWWLAALALLCARGPARLRGWTHGLLVAAAALFVGFAILPTGYWLTEALEQRFPPPRLASANIRHVVVLSGPERLPVSARTGRSELSDAAERVIEGAALARSLPDASLWIAGGITSHRSPMADVDWTAALWRRLGVAPGRIHIVRNTFNTCENAAGIAARRLRGQLLLVTSAIHMPRAVACFRSQGLSPIPYPVDYKNAAIEKLSDQFMPDLFRNMERTNTALHEWLGLVLYRLQGRTSELFPAP